MRAVVTMGSLANPRTPRSGVGTLTPRLVVSLLLVLGWHPPAAAEELKPCGFFESRWRALFLLDCPTEGDVALSRLQLEFDNAMSVDSSSLGVGYHWSEERQKTEFAERDRFSSLEVWQDTRKSGRPRGSFLLGSKIREWSAFLDSCQNLESSFPGELDDETAESLSGLRAKAEARLEHLRTEDMKWSFRRAEEIERSNYTRESSERAAEWEFFLDDYERYIDEPTNETRDLLQRAERRRVFWADEGRFEERGEDVLFDSKNGLLWTRKPNPTDVNLAGATGYCRQLRALGRGGWQVPPLAMLLSLVKPKKQSSLNPVWGQMPESFDFSRPEFSFLWSATPGDDGVTETGSRYDSGGYFGLGWEGSWKYAEDLERSGVSRTLCVLTE